MPKRKSSATPAQRAAWARLQRGPKGKFLSREGVIARDREAWERVKDLAHLTPEQFAKVAKNQRRAAQVRSEKIDRSKRYKKNPERYSFKHKPDAVTLEQQESINAGTLPAPVSTQQHGDLKEYVWSWQGAHALSTAQDALLLIAKQLPKDARGYLAMGIGHGKNAQWVGTSYGPPMQVFRESFKITDTQSGKRAFDSIQHRQTANKVFVEVKMTTKGEVKHARQVKGSAVKRTTKNRRTGKAKKPTSKHRKGTRGKVLKSKKSAGKRKR